MTKKEQKEFEKLQIMLKLALKCLYKKEGRSMNDDIFIKIAEHWGYHNTPGFHTINGFDILEEFGLRYLK